MLEFAQIVSSVPTVLFTVGLALVSVYWVFTIVGVLDIEALDGLTGDLDLDIDVDLDIEVNADLEGGAEGTPTASPGAWLWFADSLRLGRVPVAITVSLAMLWGWVTAFLLTWVAIRIGSVPVVWTTIASSVGALAGAMALTNVTTRPLEPMFRTVKARSNQALVGEVCRITTGRVDEQFGQAELTVESDHLTVQVRCDAATSKLARGEQALIIQFDSQREAFVVEPLALRAPTAQRTHRTEPPATSTTESS